MFLGSAYERCPELIVLPYNFPLYERVSMQVPSPTQSDPYPAPGHTWASDVACVQRIARCRSPLYWPAKHPPPPPPPPPRPGSPARRGPPRARGFRGPPGAASCS